MNFGDGIDNSTEVEDIHGEQEVEVTDLNKLPSADDKPNGSGGGNEEDEDVANQTNKELEDDGDDSNIPHDLEVGSEVEYDGETYTVDDNGNLVDSEGSIFKAASEVKDWVDSTEVEEVDANSITIDNLQKALDINFLDDDDNPIEFENTVEGVNALINAVIADREEEIENNYITRLYQKYPEIKAAVAYAATNSGSLKGFDNQVVDRTNVAFNPDDEEQHIKIIAASWQEFNKSGDVKSYIEFLRTSGKLKDVAAMELDAIKAADRSRLDKMAEDAAAAEQEEYDRQEQYWGTVSNIINSGKIGKYSIPKTIARSVDGKTVYATPKEFHKYLYEVDSKGNSRYDNDRQKLSSEAKLNDDLLRAYLAFTGGDYSNLVDIAISEKEVKTLKLRSAKSKSSTRGVKKTIKSNTATGGNYNFGD